MARTFKHQSWRHQRLKFSP